MLSWFYGGLFETFWNGQTPGKRLLHLRVLTVDGEPISAWQAILRNILRAADALPIVAWPGTDPRAAFLPLYMTGLLACLCSRRFQRLGDLVAGTMVVVEQRDLLAGVVPVADREVIELASQLPAPCHVEPEPGPDAGGLRRAAAQLQRGPARGDGPAVGRRSWPSGTGCRRWPSNDALLCAFYFRAFIADRPTAEREAPARVRRGRACRRRSLAAEEVIAAQGVEHGEGYGNLDQWLESQR